MLQDKALSIEDAADVLTLKDNTNSVGDFAIALHLLGRAQVSWFLYLTSRNSSYFSRIFRMLGNRQHSALFGGAFIFTTSESVSYKRCMF